MVVAAVESLKVEATHLKGSLGPVHEVTLALVPDLDHVKTTISHVQQGTLKFKTWNFNEACTCSPGFFSSLWPDSSSQTFLSLSIIHHCIFHHGARICLYFLRCSNIGFFLLILLSFLFFSFRFMINTCSS